MRRLVVVVVIPLFLVCAHAVMSIESIAADSPSKLWVFIGTYTGGESKGIYVLKLDLTTGKLQQESVVESVNPSFVAVHPSGKHVYAVNEIGSFQGNQAGAVSAFAFDDSNGKLSLINQQSSGGPGPCHLVVDATGRHVLAANYGGGSVVSLPIGDKGKLGPATSFIQHSGSSVNPQRQAGPHGHSINVDHGNRFAVAADLGLDQMLIYSFDAKTGKLSPANSPFTRVAPGGGPRHFAFHPNGRHAYVINELLLTVTAFAWDAERGLLNEIQTISTLPKGTEPQGSTAEVQVHPSGRFVYGSNRGHDSIVVYAVDKITGRLTWVENESTGGKTPRNFGVDPTGRFVLVANQASDSIVVFRIDQKSGALTPAGQSIEIPTPVCVKFLAAD